MTSPVLRVVGGGEPTDEELAALVAVVSLLQARRAGGRQAAAADRWRRSGHGSHPWHREPWLTYSRRTSLRAGE